jgi:hypothetical protein
MHASFRPLMAFFALGLASAPTAAGDASVRTLAPGASSPPARIEAAAWLVGRWVGTGLGGDVEEIYAPPAGGQMMGVFRLVRDGEPDFYEFIVLAEHEGSLLLRLKHFEPDLVGWEARDESVDFPLVALDADTLWFSGLTMRRLDGERLVISVRLGDGSDARIARFDFRRAPLGPAAPPDAER